MAGVPVSEFFASLGFKVDVSGADKFNDYLNNVEKRVRAVRAEAIKLQRTLQNTTKFRGSLTNLQNNRQNISAARQVANLNSAAESGTAKLELYSSRLDRLATALNKVGLAAANVNLPQGNFTVRTPSGDGVNSRRPSGRPSLGFGVGIGGGANQFIRNMLPFAGGSLIAGIIKSSVQTGRELAAARLSITSTSGTAEQGEANIQFVERLVDRLKIPLVDTMEQFSKINASAQGTKLEGAGIQGVMTGIMEFARARNVDPEKMSLSMRAVGQMMSKGQVMMEELKNQFAEHLPGAMQLSAKAMGMTVKELYAAVEAGEVMAEDFLPKLAAEMARVARQGDALNKSLATSAAAQQGFNNKVTLFAEKIYKVIDPILARIFNNLAKWVDTIDAEAIGKVIELILVPISALINVFQILGNILAKITFDDFLNYLDEIGPLGIIAAAWLAKISGVLRVFTFALRFLNPVFGLIVAGITLLEDVLLYFFGDGLTNTVTGQLVKWLDDLYQQLKAKLASYSLLELANLLFNPAAAATKTRPNTETGVASPKPMTPKPVGLSPQNLENIKNYGVNSMLMAKQDKSSISNIQNVKITVQGNMDSQTANRLPGLLAIPQVPVPFKN